jgi:hypothetical protein
MGVLLAFRGARAAGYRAGLDDHAEDVGVRLCLPDDDAAGDVADVGAIEAETNAADHLLHVRLGQVGVGAARARRSADAAVFDAPEQQLSVESAGPWVCLEHVSNRHELSFPSEAGEPTSRPQPLGRSRTKRTSSTSRWVKLGDPPVSSSWERRCSLTAVAVKFRRK